MRVILLFLACFLISALCEIEENEDSNLIQVKSSDILVRNLRGTERNDNANNDKRKPNKSNGKKKSIKRRSKQKAKKSEGRKKSTTSNGRKKTKKPKKSEGKKKSKKSSDRNGSKKPKGKKKRKMAKAVKKTKKNNRKKKTNKRKRKPNTKPISKKSNSRNKARKQKRKKKTGKQSKGIVRKSERNNGKARQTTTCNGTSLGSTCLTNLIDSLKYERDFVANFMNQKARAEGFNKLIGNKGDKSDSFQNSTTYLLMALGGNMSSLSCGSSNSSGELAVSTYNSLANCGPSVEMACTVPNKTVNFTQLDTCKTYYKTIQTMNAKCFTMTMKNKVNETAVCECWKTAAAAVESAKLKKDSCSAKNAQTDMKDLKNACVAAYGACKKAEDAAVGYIFECSGSGSSSSENSTVSSSSDNSTVSSSNSTNSTAGARAARLRLF